MSHHSAPFTIIFLGAIMSLGSVPRLPMWLTAVTYFQVLLEIDNLCVTFDLDLILIPVSPDRVKNEYET